MKKLFTLIIFLNLVSVTVAAEFKPFSFPFIGRWQPAEDPLLIDDYGFQDIRNLRKDGKRLRGVKGHTAINSTVIDSTHKYSKNAFHYQKSNPAESHVIVYTEDSTNSTQSKLFQNETTIPNTGDFSGTVLHTDAANSLTGRFSSAPNDRMLYANGKETMVWGGDEHNVSAFLAATNVSAVGLLTGQIDSTEKVTNQDDTEFATVNNAQDFLLIGSTQKIQGFKLYFTDDVGNSAFTVKNWTGSAWSSALSITDGTSNLTQTGWVTWTYDGSEEVRYIAGYSLYWYMVTITTPTQMKIYRVTVDEPIQAVSNVWGGDYITPVAVKYHNGTEWLVYTDEALSETTPFVLDSMANTHQLNIFFNEDVQAIRFEMEKTNLTDAPNAVLKYWDGDSWEDVTALADGTVYEGDTLGQSGALVFQPAGIAGLSTGGTLAYVYDFRVDNTIDSEVEVQRILGVPAREDLTGYSFPIEFQSRAWFFDEHEGERNKAIYSAYNSPNVFNGDDSGALYFGDGRPVTAARVLFNIYRTSGVTQLIVTKEHETWRVLGSDPDSFEVEQITDNVGCVAPLTMATAEEAEVSRGVHRQILIWQGSEGVYMCDGAAVYSISDDIKMYWDANDSRAIPSDRIGDSVGWYDPDLGSYKLLISSGSGQTSHNVELEYSLKNKEWTQLYRENGSGANPLQTGFQVSDTDGNIYSYGLTDEGYMYRLENGNTWAGTAIDQYVQTKDLLFDDERPFFNRTTARHMRLSYEDKDTSTELISVDHYCDQSLSVDGTNNQVIYTDVSMSEGPYKTQTVQLGPCLYHSFKIYTDVSTVADGMELTGLGVYYKPHTKMYEN